MNVNNESNKDYLISNNLDMNKIQIGDKKTHYGSNKEIMHKLNYIINMFEKKRSQNSSKK